MAELEPTEGPTTGAVLAKAAGRAAAWLTLGEAEFHTALGVSGLEEPLTPGSASWYDALSLIQLAFRLELLTGTEIGARQWLRGPNTGLGRSPVEVLLEPGGPATLVDYLHRFSR
jgi:hypothetical protein